MWNGQLSGRMRLPAKIKGRWAAAIAGCVFGGLVAIGSLFVDYGALLVPPCVVLNPTQQPGVGQRLSLLRLKSICGSAHDATEADLADKVVLLNLWAAWSSPSREELRALARLQMRFAGNRNFHLMTITYPPKDQAADLESLQEETLDLLRRQDLDLPVYHDPDTLTFGAVAKAVFFRGYPTTMVLDRRGVIRAVWAGYRAGVETEMERIVDDLLNERNEGAGRE
jgi:thiol-disulfide isomerase/thioredoxin